MRKTLTLFVPLMLALGCTSPKVLPDWESSIWSLGGKAVLVEHPCKYFRILAPESWKLHETPTSDSDDSLGFAAFVLQDDGTNEVLTVGVAHPFEAGGAGMGGYDTIRTIRNVNGGLATDVIWEGKGRVRFSYGKKYYITAETRYLHPKDNKLTNRHLIDAVIESIEAY